jgi:hypothetical protein
MRRREKPGAAVGVTLLLAGVVGAIRHAMSEGT